MRLPGLMALAGLLLGASAAPAAPDLDPKATYGVIVGALSWQDKGFASFPTRDRKDQELYDSLVNQGVPKENLVLLLDKQTTLTAVRKQIAEVAGKAKPGSTFVFYYCGHGCKDGKRIALANYDYTTKNALWVDEVADLLSKHFKGERVFLFADCCHSGGLAEAAKKLQKANFKALSLTSADAGNVSTVNWTYTQSVVDALQGDPLLDADGDGSITLGELATHVRREMKWREMQRSGEGWHGLAKGFKLAAVDRKRPKPVARGGFALNDYVLAGDGNGRRRVGRVVGSDGQKVVVEFYNYTDKVTVKAAPAELHRVVFRTFKVGDEVMVEWGGQWWKAKVQKAEGDFHLVRYAGYGEEWDEWVLSDRVARGDAKALRKVEIQRDKEWYPGTVLQTRDGKFLVSYDGRDEKADEWVAKERLRKPGAK